MLENKRSRVYCFCAVRSYHRSSRSAPKTRSRQARTITEMGLFCTNRSNTSPSMGASLMAKVKKAYRTQYRHTLTPLALGGSPSKVLMFLVTLSLPEGDRASCTEGQRWRCR